MIVKEMPLILNNGICALCVIARANTIGLYGETGRFPNIIEAILNSISYWYRLHTLFKFKPITKSLFGNSTNSRAGTIAPYLLVLYIY